MADLSSHYTEKHPDVRKLKEQIAKTERMKQQIAANLKNKSAQKDGSGEIDVRDGQISPIMQVQSQLKANQIEITNRQQNIADLKAKINQYQGRLNQTPVREQQLADISRDYEQSKANYDSLLAKRNQSELATNLEKRQEGEHFQILDPPSLPQKPYSPNRFNLSCMGLAAGLLFGAAGAIGAEMTDDRIYSEKEIKKLFSLEILTELPRMLTPDEQQKQRRALIRDLVSVSAIMLCVVAGLAAAYLRG
jgi:uncharacterized protein involved in exopolysaccharide biosynthesis